MTRKKKAVIVTAIVFVSLFVLAQVLSSVMSYLFTPESFVPMDQAKCADSAVKFVFTHGFPDEVNKDSYNIDGRVSLIYTDKEIMGQNMDCEYNFAFGLFNLTGSLVGVSYSTVYDDMTVTNILKAR